jgi:POT family proton-dependent oligopeptide transporter
VGILSDFTPALVGVPLVIAWIAFVYLANRNTHPRVLFSLFLVELWERFSYYGMRAFLVLYLTNELITGGLGFAKATATGIYAAYGALVYLTPILGGFLADKVWGSRKAIVWGAMLMALGQFTLAGSAFFKEASKTPISAEAQRLADSRRDYIDKKVEAGLTTEAAKAAFKEEIAKLAPPPTLSSHPDTYRKTLLFLGLALLTLGNGFFKPNISSMIGRFYEPGDARRDGAFTIFYMGINIGAFISPLVCGTFAEEIGWGYGFLIAGTGMIIGLLMFLNTSRSGLLEDKADPPAAPVNGHRILGIPADTAILFGSVLLLPILSALLVFNGVMDYLLIGLSVVIIGYLLSVAQQYEMINRQRIWVIVVLLLFTTVFWAFFELAGGALNIFTDVNVQKNLLGVTLTTSNFQALNALFIMIFAPIFAVMWIKLANANAEPSSPVKFSIGLAMVGVGFFLLLLAKPLAKEGMIPAIFLAGLYLAHTLGELALSPVGLSLVTKLAPEKVAGMMMGAWFLSSSLAHQAGKWIGEMMFDEKKIQGLSAAESLDSSLGVLTQVGMFAVGSAVVLLLLSPILKRWMHGVK